MVNKLSSILSSVVSLMYFTLTNARRFSSPMTEVPGCLTCTLGIGRQRTAHGCLEENIVNLDFVFISNQCSSNLNLKRQQNNHYLTVVLLNDNICYATSILI